MTTLDDVIAAHQKIGEAERAYRQTVRDARDAGVTQESIREALGVTREKIRTDTMPEDERTAYIASKSAARARQADA